MLRQHHTWQPFHSSWPSATPEAWRAIHRRIGNFRTYYGLKHYSHEELYAEYRAFRLQHERSRVRSFRQVFSGGCYQPGAVNKKTRRQDIKQRRQGSDYVPKRGRPKKVAPPVSSSEPETVQSAAPPTGSPSEPRSAVPIQAEPVPLSNQEPTIRALQSELMLMKQRMTELESRLALPAQALSVGPHAGNLTLSSYTSSPPVLANIILAQQAPSVSDDSSERAPYSSSANPTGRHESIEFGSPLASERPTAALRSVIVGDEAARQRQTLLYGSLTSAPLNLPPYLPSPLSSSNWPYAPDLADMHSISSGLTSRAGMLTSPPSTASSLPAPSPPTGAQSIVDPGSQRSVRSFDSTGLFAVPTPTFPSLPSMSILAAYSSPLREAERVHTGDGEVFEDAAETGHTQAHMAATRDATNKRKAEGRKQTGQAKKRQMQAAERLGAVQDRTVERAAAAAAVVAAASEREHESSEVVVAAQDEATPAVHQLLLMSSPNAVSALQR